MIDALGQLVNIGEKVFLCKKSRLIPCEYLKETTKLFILQAYDRQYTISKFSINTAPIQASNYTHPMKMYSDNSGDRQMNIVKVDQTLITL